MGIKERILIRWQRMMRRGQACWQQIISSCFKNKKQKRKILLFSGLAFFICLAALLFIVPFFVSAARVELLILKQEIEQGGPCHEACLLARQEKKEKIAGRLFSEKRLQADLEKYLFSSDIGRPELRRELMEIIILAIGDQSEPPAFLVDYLAKPAGRAEIKAEIINFFLAPLSDRNLAEYYLAILESGEEEIMKKAALLALSNVPDNELIWRADDLALISRLIIDEKLSPGFRLDLFFLLSSYQEIFPEEAMLALSFIKEAVPEPELKYLSGEQLLKLGRGEEALPVPNEEAWLKYFN